jgi:salicylate hydroxylase
MGFTITEVLKEGDGMKDQLKVIIAGGGIGGLTAALSLIRRGFRVRVFEQAPEIKELGAGLQLAPDGTRILIALGLQAACEAVVCEADYKEVRLWDSGTRRKLFDLGEDSRRRFGFPYWFVNRGDLHTILLRAVKAADPDCVQTGKKCIGFTQSATGVEITFEDYTQASGDMLVGADGVHSVIRTQGFASPTPAFTGMICWRGVARMSDLPEELRTHAGTNWVGQGGHIVTYAVQRGEIMNFAGTVERQGWQTECWSATGSTEECHADFEGWHSSVHAMIDALDQPYKLALVGRKPLKTWQNGRVILLGDAAHPTLPFLAHGSIMALEDGFILARCLELAGSDVEQALKRFEATRIKRCNAIVDGSAENAARFHNPLLADPVSAVRYLDEQWTPEKVRQRYDWLFEYDAINTPIAEVGEYA